MDEKDQERLRLLLELFPNAAAQLRGALGNIEFAVSRLVLPEASGMRTRSWISGPLFWIRAITVCCGW